MEYNKMRGFTVKGDFHSHRWGRVSKGKSFFQVSLLHSCLMANQVNSLPFLADQGTQPTAVFSVTENSQPPARYFSSKKVLRAQSLPFPVDTEACQELSSIQFARTWSLID